MRPSATRGSAPGPTRRRKGHRLSTASWVRTACARASARTESGWRGWAASSRHSRTLPASSRAQASSSAARPGPPRRPAASRGQSETASAPTTSAAATPTSATQWSTYPNWSAPGAVRATARAASMPAAVTRASARRGPGAVPRASRPTPAPRPGARRRRGSVKGMPGRGDRRRSREGARRGHDGLRPRVGRPTPSRRRQDAVEVAVVADELVEEGERPQQQEHGQGREKRSGAEAGGSRSAPRGPGAAAARSPGRGRRQETSATGRAKTMWLWTARLPASTTSASARPSPVARRAAARRATPKGSRPTFGFQEENSQPSPRAWSSRQHEERGQHRPRARHDPAGAAQEGGEGHGVPDERRPAHRGRVRAEQLVDRGRRVEEARARVVEVEAGLGTQALASLRRQAGVQLDLGVVGRRKQLGRRAPEPVGDERGQGEEPRAPPSRTARPRARASHARTAVARARARRWTRFSPCGLRLHRRGRDATTAPNARQARLYSPPRGDPTAFTRPRRLADGATSSRRGGVLPQRRRGARLPGRVAADPRPVRAASASTRWP